MAGELFHAHKQFLITKKIKKILLWSFAALVLLVLFHSSTFKAKDPIQGISCGGVADLRCPDGYDCKVKSVAENGLGVCKKQINLR